jgi:hypothetical protein
MRQFLGWLVREAWRFGWHLEDGDGNAKPVIRETATMFSIILTSAAVLVVAQLETNRPIWSYILVFSAVSLANIIGMVCILMDEAVLTTGNSAVSRRHAYDWASIWFTRWTLLASVFITVAVVALAWTSRLPGQSFNVEKKVEIEEPSRYEFKDDKSVGIVVPVKISRDLYPRGIPPKLIMEIVLRDAVAQEWKIVDVDGEFGPPTKTTLMDPPPAEYRKTTEEKNKSFWYLNKLEADQTYLLRFYVHEKGARGDVKALLEAIQKKGLSVSLYSQEK